MTNPKEKKPKEAKLKDFESALSELESLVTKLEDGNVTLEQSLALFERGVELSRYCHKRLEEAEKRIEVLTEQGKTKSAPDSIKDQIAEKEQAPTESHELTEDDIPF